MIWQLTSKENHRVVVREARRMSIWPVEDDLELSTRLSNLIQPMREAVLLLYDEEKLFVITLAARKRHR